MKFVDTNYFVSYFSTHSEKTQRGQAHTLFRKAAKKEIKLYTNTIVFFELFWVMRTKYKRSKQELITILESFLSLFFISIQERDILTTALELFTQHSLDLEDCYHMAYSMQADTTDFITFDKKLAKLWSDQQS